MNQTWEIVLKPNFGPNFCLLGRNLGPKNFRYCRKLSSYSISRKTYDPNSRKWGKTSFWAWFRHVGPKFGPPIFLFKNLASSVTRYHGQLSSCKILKKNYWSNLEKIYWRMDGRTDGHTDGQMDESDFIGRCLTDIEHPTESEYIL